MAVVLVLLASFPLFLTSDAEASVSDNITDWSGTFQSPYYPRSYGPNMDCYWLIQVSEGNLVEISFQDFQMMALPDDSAEKDANCPNDYVEVLDGSYGSTDVIKRLCGFSLPNDPEMRTFRSSSNFLLVHMHTDSENHNRGFIAKHTGICDVVFTAGSGAIKSPNHPANYPDNLECVWVIDLGLGYDITLTFHKFILERKEDCSYDWLSVQEGNSEDSPEITKVCAKILPPDITTRGPMRITFQTDGDKAFEGFHVTYQAQASGTIGSPSPTQKSDRVMVHTFTQENVTFDTGDKVDLNCKILKANMSITAQWIRHKTREVLMTKNYTDEVVFQPAYNQFNHIIDKVSVDDEGRYTCKATYWNSTSSIDYEDSYNLKVRASATTVSSFPTQTSDRGKVYIFTQEDVKFDTGDEVDLNCKILKANMSITAQWIRHRTREVLVTKNYTATVNFQPAYKQFHHIIDKVSVDDEGRYTCKATYWNSTSSIDYEDSYNLKVREPHENGHNTPLVASLAAVSALFCLSIVICVVYHNRRVSAQRNDASGGMAENPALETGDSDTRYLSLTSSCWEVVSKQINLQKVLGNGSFGEVWKAVAWGLKGIPGETEVAVKKLKHNSSDTEKESLAQEIELGKSLDGHRHPNIVNFLGCVSTTAPMMLILEYVPYGDLLGYLRKSRGIEDKHYSCPENCQQEVTPYDLLSFAQQIASGMSFLASKKILHRDLAARNVLVGMGGICKITDFGLALIRDKYQYLYCTAIRKGRLPIKWTAPEHLFNDAQDKDVRVSEKSDVWSYGVVLYEIFTLGGVPYPGWNEWKVVYELKVNKYRMSQPEHVSEELYQIMLDCWNEDPNNRPTFDRLHEQTTEFLQDEHYVDLDMSKYEPSLYTNVEEIAASISQPTSVDLENTQLGITSKDLTDAPNEDSRL